jgi:hypothetical protein
MHSRTRFSHGGCCSAGRHEGEWHQCQRRPAPRSSTVSTSRSPPIPSGGCCRAAEAERPQSLGLGGCRRLVLLPRWELTAAGS